MPNWTRLTPPASGAFNTKTITRVAGIIFAVMLAVVFLSQQCFSTAPAEPEGAVVADEPAGPRTAAALGARVQDIEQRAAMERDAAERSLGQSRDDLSLAGGQVTPAYDPTTGARLDPDTAGPGIVTASQAEADLREQLRLEAIERQSRSIRSEPVAISYRTLSGDPPADGPTAGSSDGSTPPPPDPPTFLDSLAALSATAHALDAQVGGAEFDDATPPAGAIMPAARPTQAAGPPPPSPLGPADGAAVPRGACGPRSSKRPTPPQGGSGSMKGRLSRPCS